MNTGRAIQQTNPHYKIETVSRVYPDVNATYGSSWYDCEFDVVGNSPAPYEISKWLGSGKYSDVFIGYKGDQRVALKVLKAVRPQKYKREIKILQNLKGGVNIVTLLEIVENPISHQYTLVFEYIENAETYHLYPHFTDSDARYYLYQLLKALQFSHSRGIMHRDIKPQNIMYDHKTRQLRLIDWGLAEFYHPKQKYNIHVASRHFKAIELLVDYQCYDYSVDLWAFAVTMAGIIFNRNPFFKGNDDFDMVAKIAQVLGKADLEAYLTKYGIQIPEGMQKGLVKVSSKRKNLGVVFKGRLVTPDAIDLLDQCLRYDHMTRISADEALQHPYFRQIRKELGE
jgi:casein kinase II subunit alpha